MTAPHHELTGPADAPVLVLGSSLGTTGAALWAPQLPALRDFRVLRYDHRGHGGSPAPPGPYTIDDLGGDVLALLDALSLPRVSYCGVSLGGMVGMWLAAHAPERVDRLVLCCTTARFPSADPWRERAARVRAEGMTAIAGPVVARWFTPGYAARRPDIVAHFTDVLCGTDPDAYAACCDVLSTMDLLAALPAIAAPTLVIAAEDDLAIPPAHSAAIAGAVPGARLLTIPDAAHLAGVEQPAAVTGALRAHLLD